MPSLTNGDQQTLSDWMYVVTGPYRVTGWAPGPSNDGKTRLQPIRIRVDASASDVMHYCRTYDAVSVVSPSGSEIVLPRGTGEDVASPPVSLSEFLEELESWPEFLEESLPGTVAAEMDLCDQGRAIADKLEEVADFIRDAVRQIRDRGLDRATV